MGRRKTRNENPIQEHIDRTRRARLTELGWEREGGKVHGKPLWRDPQGCLKTEAAAFAYLQRLDEIKEETT